MEVPDTRRLSQSRLLAFPTSRRWPNLTMCDAMQLLLSSCSLGSLGPPAHNASLLPVQVVPRACFGYASDPGGRGYQDDRCAAFSTRLWDGRRATVAAVLDGHHGHQMADMMAEQLPYAFKAAMDKRRNVPEGLVSHAVPPPPPLALQHKPLFILIY